MESFGDRQNSEEVLVGVKNYAGSKFVMPEKFRLGTRLCFDRDLAFLVCSNLATQQTSMLCSDALQASDYIHILYICLVWTTSSSL